MNSQDLRMSRVEVASTLPGTALVQDLQYSNYESGLREDDTDQTPRLAVQRPLEI